MDADGPQKTAVVSFPKLRSRVRIPFPAPLKSKFTFRTSVLANCENGKKLRSFSHDFPRFFPRLAEFDFSHRSKLRSGPFSHGLTPDRRKVSPEALRGAVERQDRAHARLPDLCIAEDQGQSLTCDPVCRRCSVESDGAEFEHLRFEDRAAVSDLLSTGLTAAGRMATIVGKQTFLLCRRVDSEQEEAFEQVEDLVYVQRDATDEHGRLLLGQYV